MKKVILCFITAVALSACVSAPEPIDEPQDETLQYPASPIEQQTYALEGETIDRFFPWLEQSDSINSQQWLAAQNQLSDSYLTATSEHQRLRNALPQYWNFERHSAPERHGRFYFYWQNDGLQNHSALYVREGLQGVPRRILDPNDFSSEGFASIGDISISPDARYVAYSRYEAGSEWPELRIRDTQSGQDLDDRLRGIKKASVSWLNDGSGFYYSRYPETPGGEPDGDQAVAIYFHRLGSAQRNDRRIYDLSAYPGWNPYPQVTRDGRFLVARIERDDAPHVNAIHLLDLTARNARWQPLLNAWDGHYKLIDSDANLLFFKTTMGAPSGRIVALDIQRPDAAHWQELVPEQAATLHEVRYVGGKFIAHYRQQEQSKLAVYNAYGRFESSIEVPNNGNVQQLSGQASHLEAFFLFDSPTDAGTSYHYDVANQSLQVLQQSQFNIELSQYRTDNIALSETAVLRLTYRTDRPTAQPSPTLLTLEEQLHNEMTSAFSSERVTWLDRGGVVATLLHQTPSNEPLDSRLTTSYEALLSAIEYLGDNGYATPATLVLQGSGNAGWVVNHALTLQPDKFAAVLSHASLADTFTGQASATMTPLNSAEQVRKRLASSPLHHLMEQNGTVCLPPTLVTASAKGTGEAPNAIEPWQSYKWAAALQTQQSCEHPMLLKVTADADDAQPQPTWVRIERALAQLSFVFEQLQSNSQSSNLIPEP